jgi:hypothetical protein
MPSIHRYILALTLFVLAAFGASAMAACAPPDVQGFRDDPSTSKPKKKPPAGSSTKKDGGLSNGNDDGDDGDDGNTPSVEAPTLTGISPDSIAMGTASANGVDIALTGSRFVAGCKVDVAGTKVDASLSSPMELKARIPGNLLGTAKSLKVTVVSPTKGASNALTFTVANPTSVSISTLSPATATIGANNVAITVNGSGFIQTSVVRFNGAALTTTFGSAALLNAVIPSAALQDAGRVSVTVANGTDVISLPAQFEIANPTPTISTLSPRTAEAGSGAVSINIDGNGFTGASEVIAGQSPLATTLVSNTRLRATIPAQLLTNAGTLQVRVNNPAPVGGPSNNSAFTITPRATTTTTSSSGTTAACTYTCAEYGYASGECYEGWACNGATGCLKQQTCTGTGTGTGSQAASCVYKCSDYGYAPGQCVNGWVCLSSGEYAGCLGTTSGGC